MNEGYQPPLFDIPQEPATDAEAMSRHIAAAASRNPILEYPDNTSEAARDQGHGPQEKGVPIEDEDHPRRKPEAIVAQKKAATSRRRRRGSQENRYTDVGSDLAAIIDAGKEVEARGLIEADKEPAPPAEVSKAKIDRILTAKIVRRTLDDAGNDANYSTALLKSRTEPRE